MHNSPAPPSHAPAWDTPSHAPAWDTPSHAPAWDIPSHAPAWDTPSHAPAWDPENLARVRIHEGRDVEDGGVVIRKKGDLNHSYIRSCDIHTPPWPAARKEAVEVL